MTEADLIARAQAGDRQAFGELVARHQTSVYASCLRLTGNAADADDLTHDALVEAWLKLRQLRDPDRFAGWLRTLTLNVFRMWYRRPALARDGAELSDDIPATDGDTEERESLYATLSRCLFRLSSNHRVVLVLHYLEGLSYEEIAAFLDVPIGTVMSRLHRGRRALEGLVSAPAQEEASMDPTDGLRDEVLAEIQVLLELFREQPETAERLSAILERSPARVGQLIRSSANDEALRSMGALLPRLGATAIRVALDAFFAAPDARAASNATAVLEAAVARCRGLSWPGACDPSVEPHGYRFIDQLVAYPAPASKKADLLLALVRAARDAGVQDLLVDVLLAQPDGAAAASTLLAAYAQTESAADLRRPVLNALCRLGTRLAAAVLEDLQPGEGGAGDARRQLIALAAAEHLAHALRLGRGDDDRADSIRGEASPARRALQARHEGLVEPDAVEPALMSAIAARTAAIAAVSGVEENDRLREAAVRTLGALGDPAHAPAVRALLSREPSTTKTSLRIAAIRAASSLHDGAAIEDIVRTAANAGVESAERVAAIEALGRLEAWGAKDELVRLSDDPSEPVQVAAITALGELGGDEVEALLRRACSTGSLARRKAAAKALHRRSRPVSAPSELSRKLWEIRRGPDARPVADISLEATLRYALGAERQRAHYDERELSRRIGRVCVDVSSVRRMLVELGLMTREEGTYELTGLGEAAWRVERYVAAALDRG